MIKIKKCLLNMIIIFCLLNIIISLVYFFGFSKIIFSTYENVTFIKWLDRLFSGESLFFNKTSCSFMIYFIGSFIALAISAANYEE